jgi:hypothetical protein
MVFRGTIIPAAHLSQAVIRLLQMMTDQAKELILVKQLLIQT